MTKIQKYRDQIIEELSIAAIPNNTYKDILIVVHDQLYYVQKCIESIFENTENYILRVYDNGSAPPTRDYLADLDDQGKLVHEYVGTNNGFIEPNNYLAKQAQSPYIICLNSDTEVKPGWDLAMVNFLELNPEVAQVGYCGSMLNKEGQGTEAAFGYDPDFICGWCFCIPRKTYWKHGLFDETNLDFAYGEDSDFSLRLKEAGEKIYSLHADLVVHHGNKTILEVHRELGNYVKGTFERNHEYIRRRWSTYLEKRN
jgi:GT2 family glycosyltransferase